MTGIRPDGLDGWLSPYFQSHGLFPTDATSVAPKSPTLVNRQIPTIGPQPAYKPAQPEFGGVIGALMSAGDKLSNYITSTQQKNAIAHEQNVSKYGINAGMRDMAAQLPSTVTLGTSEVPAIEGAVPGAADRFAVLTAENPRGMPLSAAENAPLNAQLRQRLRATGLPFSESKGFYPDDKTGQQLSENSFFVKGMYPGHAEDLGREFGQNSVLTQHGLHDLASGTITPSSGVRASTPEDLAYTQFPNGTKFTSDLDWSKSHPSAAGVPQTDLSRYMGARIPKSRLEDVEQEMYNTTQAPDFLSWLKNGKFADWYNTPKTQQKAADALGSEGPSAFDRLMNFMGTTTARSSPPNNLRRASYYYGLDRQGLLTPEDLNAGIYKDVPAGMGHLANDAHHGATADYLENGQIDPLKNPKPASFVQNLMGNFRPFTNDTRMATGAATANPRLVDMGAIVKSVGKDGAVTYSPRNWAYAPLERGFQRGAQDYLNAGHLELPSGADPTAYSQAKIWDGLSGVLKGASPSSGTFDDVFAKKVDDAAKMWGVSPDVANKMMWSGQQPFDLKLGTPLLPKALRGILDR